MKILDNQKMVNPVERFGKINLGHYNSMRFLLVHVGVNEVKESDKIM